MPVSHISTPWPLLLCLPCSPATAHMTQCQRSCVGKPYSPTCVAWNFEGPRSAVFENDCFAHCMLEVSGWGYGMPCPPSSARCFGAAPEDPDSRPSQLLGCKAPSLLGQRVWSSAESRFARNRLTPILYVGSCCPPAGGPHRSHHTA